MDGTVNDFFNEIDQIAPPKEPVNDSVWQECFDSGSGYAYYWNVKTDEVTWEMPEDYKLWKEQNALQKSGNLYVPPKSTPLFPSTKLSTTKIYKIQEDSQNVALDSRRPAEPPQRHLDLKHAKKLRIDSNGSEEKVILSLRGDDPESKNDVEKQTRTVNIVKDELVILGPHLPDSATKQINSNSNSCSNSDNEEDDTDLLTKIQKRAKVLKDLGGELPPDVKKLVESDDPVQKKGPSQKSAKKDKKDVTGFSLVAGYGESEEEEEEEVGPTLPLASTKTMENKISHSTLFPISKPIDVKQFSEVKKEVEPPDLNLIDSKAFHRKRRIGIDFASATSKIETPANHRSDNVDAEKQGLGFKAEKEAESGVVKNDLDNTYPGFKRGGVMFIKTDVLNPSGDSDKLETSAKEDVNDSQSDTMMKIEETHKTLNEKLTFLSEGREPVSPVQIMIIQMETLYEAMKAGNLTSNYLHKWLKETCSELVKLEKDAAPSGWLLQWDRVNKRYYYRNQQTGDSQWEYPQPDIVGGDEAMDISTTPPPPPIVEDGPTEPAVSMNLPVQPPPPPRIKSPTPPPPPTISQAMKQKKKLAKTHSSHPLLPEIEPHLPPLPPTENFNKHGEPLPPGVDSSEITPYGSPPASQVTKETAEPSAGDVLGSALTSFYSDLAAMESEVPIAAAIPELPQPANDPLPPNMMAEVPAKKKKKSKVKLVQGLAMKKKGVSKLVERWKNVQKDYN